MSWWGKLLGGALGWMLGGPLGAMLGAALGHRFDKGLAGMEGMEVPGGWGDQTWELGEQERVQSAFFTATFAIMGHLAKVDGQVTRDEIRLAEAVMAHMRLPAEMRRTAIELFNRGKEADFPFDEVLTQLRDEVHRRRSLARVFVEIQVQACLADGVLHPAERQLLERISDALGLGRQELAQIIQLVGAARDFRGGSSAGAGRTGGVDRLAEAYAVLGVEASASDAEIKRAYRRLMSQHHPDKLVAKGLPEEMMQLAKEKTQEIKAAYETIRKVRG